MEVRRLNTERSYGTIYGHDIAMYEQDGILFGGDMKELPKEDADPVEEQIRAQAAPKTAEDFLKVLLHETTMPKSNVYKESQLQKFNWDKVQKAAEKLAVHIYQVKGVEMWKLTND